MTDTIELTFDVFTLPTAQHRAGLAGLVVLIDSLSRRGIGPLPITDRSDNGEARFGFTKECLQTLFDDLYDGFWEERQKTRNKPQGSKLRNLRVEQTDQGTRYVYEVVAPKAAFYDPYPMPPPWQKLWREAMWSTVRGIPLTRKPFEDRADGRPTNEAGQVWSDLEKWRRARERGQLYSAEVASSLFMGAQAFNAERVPFRGAPDQNLLLHFWPVVAGVGEASSLKFERGEPKEEPTGFVLTIPDVSDVDGFAQDFSRAIAELGTAMVGYRPRDAILAVPEEGALEYLHHLLAIAQAKAIGAELRFSVTGVEAYHLEKKGNNIHIRASGAVPADPNLIDRYDAMRRKYRHPLVRAQFILNLLRNDPWYRGFGRVFSTYDRKFFLGPGDTGANFQFDIRRKFQDELRDAGSGRAS